MKETIFREYDIRGKVGSELLLEEVYPLGHALARYFLQKNSHVRTIAIGMDGRIHSRPIKDELCRAFNDAGIDVICLGVCPSPVLYFALHTQHVDGGLMVTASHNGPEYNGIKVCVGTKSIWGKELKDVYALYRQGVRVASDHTGTTSDMPIIPDYIAWLKNHFSALEAMSLRAVVDCGNGAGGTVLPALIDAMEWRGVTLLYPEVDGTFPHHEADPIVPENMHEVKEVLQTTDAALGIGLDGDADRMAPMTKSGYLVPGDVLLSIFAQPILEKNPGASIVFDLKSSAGLAESIIKHGGKPVMSASGHSIIKDVMREHKALVGGELSCHFFFADRYFGYDDGIYAMMRLFELLFESGKTLQELVDEFPFKCSSPEYRIACKPEEKTKIVATVLRAFQQQKGVSISTLDGVRVQFSDGWGIVRPSNTQAVMSMRFEADTNEGLGRIKKEFMLILESYFTKDVLSKEFGIE